MSTTVRAMQEKDRSEVMEMMRAFYMSPAVLSDGSDEIFGADIDNCIGDCPYLEGFVFEGDGKIKGYAMIAKSFSTEFGKLCIWIEDLYIKDGCRGQGIGSLFLEFVEKKHPEAIFRLEVEQENEKAVSVYEKHGYRFLGYMEMKK